MAYAVYYRRKGDKVFARVSEFFKPTRTIKNYVTTDGGERLGIRDLRCKTMSEAIEIATCYELKGCETKIKTVK